MDNLLLLLVPSSSSCSFARALLPLNSPPNQRVVCCNGLLRLPSSSLRRVEKISIRDFRARSAPYVPRLAETARITLTPDEVEEVGPKIQQVLDWFGQLQAVDLDTVEPAVRADTEGDNFRDDVPEIFEHREAIIAAIPCYEEPYIRVPKVLNKE